MTVWTALLSVAVMLGAGLTPAAAQTPPQASSMTKVVPGEMKVVTVTVEAIERPSREITVKKSDGTYDVVYVPSSLKRFDTLKVGDKITTKYYETMVIRLKPAGEADVDESKSGAVPTEGKASGTASHQRTFTATITAIDPKVPSITFTGPRGWTYSSRVKDKEALSKVKVNDKVDLTFTEALLLSIDN